MKEPLIVPYCEARKIIRGGDLLLFRPRGFPWRAIAVAGRSEYTHAAMAGWWHGRLMCIEMCSGGGRAMLLSNLVRCRPGIIDVFAAGGRSPSRRGEKKEPSASGLQPPAYNRTAAVRAMIDITGRRYGWFNLARASLLHLPLVRFFVSPDTNDAECGADSAGGAPPFCSQAVATAARAGGVDPVPNLADRLTEPGDLARSPFFRYQFTLI